MGVNRPLKLLEDGKRWPLNRVCVMLCVVGCFSLLDGCGLWFVWCVVLAAFLDATW